MAAKKKGGRKASKSRSTKNKNARKPASKSSKKTVIKKTVPKNSQPKEGQPSDSNTAMYLMLVLGVAVIIAGIYFISQPSDEGAGDGKVIGAALDGSREAMSIAEDSNNISISRSEGEIKENSTYYSVSFPVTDSEAFDTFDVVLDKELNVQYIGFNGDTKDPENFIASQKGPNEFQVCAKRFNEQGIIPRLIGDFYNRSAGLRAMMTMPKSLECNGEKYPYSLEVGDGYVTTTLNGNYFKNSFTKGIVTNTMTIPSEDIEDGVLVYVDVVGEKQIKFSYVLSNKSKALFDAYDPSKIFEYKLDNINRFPALVWNCKDVTVGSMATSELNGTVKAGTEQTILATFACLFNKGQPTDICEPLGITKDENGTIQAGVPKEFLFNMATTGQDACRVDNDTTRVEAFYPINCTQCRDQRIFLDRIGEIFGDHLEITYHCVGDKPECTKRLKSSLD
jgi:hypothetical protein